MNSKQLYVMICSIISQETTVPYKPSVREFSAPVDYHIAYNHGKNSDVISHASVEFKGVRAKFLSILTFDGAGPSDTAIYNFNMLRQKLSLDQKALMCLAVMEFLTHKPTPPVACGWPIVDADFELLREKIQHAVSGGVGDILERYDLMRESAFIYVEQKTEFAQARVNAIIAA